MWCEFQTLYPKSSRIEIWNPVRPTTRRQPQDDKGSKESYPTNLDPAHLRAATILSQQATLQTSTDEVTGQGAYQGIIRWREPTNSELFQGGRAQDDRRGDFRPHQRQTYCRASATWRKVSRRRQYRRKRKRRNCDHDWPKNLSGRNTIYHTICNMYMWTPTTIIPT